ncbi:MAG: serine aminopeptidase domain-containing protein [Halanaerobiales bacterium]
MKASWKHIYINENIFCNSYFHSKEAPNIIVTHTPIVSTIAMKPAYQALQEFGVNIFAIDFTGTGKSRGNSSEFSLESLCNDLDETVEFITEGYSDNIHVFGYTGIGGIFAQYYLSGTNKIKTFSQFACAIPGDTRSLGIPFPVARVLLGIMKGITFVRPEAKMPWSPPKYTGYNAELDNSFYEDLAEKYPEAMKSAIKIFEALFECITSKESKLKQDINCPTLVFKTLHDRYFPAEYFDRYYEQLKCKKKLVTFDDVHNIYYYKGDKFCEKVVEWIKQ